MNRIETGKLGEDNAVSYLESIGYVVSERNYRTPFGEIDLIARDGKTIVFIEIKTRRSNLFGYPEEAVTRTKQQKMIRSAQAYLKKINQTDASARFDVLAIEISNINSCSFRLISNAFELSS